MSTINTQREDDIRALLQSIEASPLAMIVTDNREADNPIIAANEAFLKLTGYSSGEVIGRNCRFLSGPGTEAEARAELRRAVSEARPTVVELTNYRKDGSPFRNAVMIAPVRDERGRAALFVGSQVDTGPSGASSGLRQERARKLVDKLTPRLRQVLELMVAGYRNKQIGGFLDIQENTVKMHRERLIEALEVKTSAEAIRIAVEAGLIVSDPERSKTGR